MNPIVDYDPEKRILHITAEQKIIVSDEKTLNEMCNFVCSFLTENGKGERSYMIVDISIQGGLFQEKFQCFLI